MKTTVHVFVTVGSRTCRTFVDGKRVATAPLEQPWRLARNASQFLNKDWMTGIFARSRIAVLQVIVGGKADGL